MPSWRHLSRSNTSVMPLPVLDASRARAQPAEPFPRAGAAVSARLPEVERGLSALSAPAGGRLAGLLAWVTGSVDRDGLRFRYQAWQDAQARGDLTTQARTLGELRVAFERFQDHCSADDYLVAQRAYADIDAALARLRLQARRPGR